MEGLKVIAFTHKHLPLELIGKLHLSEDLLSAKLPLIKEKCGAREFLYLNTCNRVEFFLVGDIEADLQFIKTLCLQINPTLIGDEADLLCIKSELFEEEEGVEHLLRVASSLDSLVVGEREIITQVRKAYDSCRELGITGDLIRILVKQCIETAKEVYTKTNIARNPVSVVSLAYRQLKDLGIKDNARILFVGSGVTNSAMASYLHKHKFANFTVFNRTLANAKKLADVLGGKAYSLEELKNYKEGFDVLVVCTASNSALITPEIYASLNTDENSRKIVIDLGIPANVSAEVREKNRINYISIDSLREKAQANLELRKMERSKCEEIIAIKTKQFSDLHNERKIELAFGEIPRQVKAINQLAVSEVFAKDISKLDEQSKEVLDKILAYVEKKYNAMAIKTAKEALKNPRN